MRMRERKFIVLKYYIIRSKQRTIHSSEYKDDEEGKKQLFVDSFLKNDNTFKWKRSNYVLSDVESKEGIFFGKLARKGTINFPTKVGTHIRDKEEITYPYSYFIVDTKYNNFIIEPKTNVFVKDDTSINELIREILSAMVTVNISNEGYICKFETIDEKRAFWNAIALANKVYYFELTLNSPNILFANESAKQDMELLHEEYNNTSATIKLENEEGNLVVKQNRINENYVEYAEEGGGRWRIKTDKEIIKSSDKVFTIRKKFNDIKIIASEIIEVVRSSRNKP